VLLPKVANDAVPIGWHLDLNTWVDLRNGLDDLQSLQRIIAGAQGRAIEIAAAEKLLAGLTPYRGILPFREQDASLFFGRDWSPRRLFRREDDNAVTLNTPHKLNALSLAMIEALTAEFDAIATDDPARVWRAWD
jgi:hypothetical protein